MDPIAKPIPPARDRLQSRILVWTIAPLLCVISSLAVAEALLDYPRITQPHLEAIGISLAFALLVWLVKAATPAAAACGETICILLTFFNTEPGQPSRSGLPALITLFLLTYFATRARRDRKAKAGLAEDRGGRNAAQVIANLGVAALLAFPVGLIATEMMWPSGGYRGQSSAIAVLVLSALAEATADTVSSEIGQAFGGTPFLITSLRRVPTGTDGAISLTGTIAGIAAATIVAAAGAYSMHLSLGQSSIALAAGICGLFFDSILGATLEHRGWLGNDLVNFCSTVFSPALCLLALWIIPNLGPQRLFRY
jgi:uncharacterized protein (TIGR00297 family)